MLFPAAHQMASWGEPRESVVPLFTPCLCLVTDSSLCTSDSLEDMVDGAVAGGVDMVQLREKEFSKKELIKL